MVIRELLAFASGVFLLYVRILPGQIFVVISDAVFHCFSPTTIPAAMKFPRTYVRILVRTANKNVPTSPKTSFLRLLHVFICIFQIFVVILHPI